MLVDVLLDVVEKSGMVAGASTGVGVGAGLDVVVVLDVPGLVLDEVLVLDVPVLVGELVVEGASRAATAACTSWMVVVGVVRPGRENESGIAVDTSVSQDDLCCLER